MQMNKKPACHAVGQMCLITSLTLGCRN